MTDLWSSRIHRAGQLALAASPSQHLVAFYATLLGAQFEVYRALAGATSTLTGNLMRDLPTVRPALAPVFDAVAAAGPGELVQRVLASRDGPGEALDARLLAYWQRPSDSDFLAKACLQPYARRLVDAGVPIEYDHSLAAPNRCPNCAGRPQAACISGSPVSGARSLLCARCLSPWSVKRVSCAHCGEEGSAQLGYHRSPAYAHVRLDTCETCRQYVKTIDLSVLGFADPLVDDVASGALDLWAVQRGYVKVERNLVGL